MLNFVKIHKQLRVSYIFMARFWYKFTTTKKHFMKKLIFTLGLVAGLSALTFAQEAHSANDGHGHAIASNNSTINPGLVILDGDIIDEITDLEVVGAVKD